MEKPKFEFYERPNGHNEFLEFLENLPQKDKTLLLDLRIDSMSLSAAEWIAPKIDTKYKLKKMLKK